MTTQIQLGNKLQYIPLQQEVDWSPLFRASKRGTQRQVKKVCKCLETPDGERYYEVEIEGHELESYYVKMFTSKYGARGSCHCPDFRFRKLPQFRDKGVGQWCKHLLIAYLAIRDLEDNQQPIN